MPFTYGWRREKARAKNDSLQGKAEKGTSIFADESSRQSLEIIDSKLWSQKTCPEKNSATRSESVGGASGMTGHMF
jgi:hypothetical protein